MFSPFKGLLNTSLNFFFTYFIYFFVCRNCLTINVLFGSKRLLSVLVSILFYFSFKNVW